LEDKQRAAVIFELADEFHRAELLGAVIRAGYGTWILPAGVLWRGLACRFSIHHPRVYPVRLPRS